MKTFIQAIIILGMVVLSYGQITFNGAHPLFDDQSFVFSFEAIDDTGRHSYTTAPIDGNQPCSGIGICELKISWNNTDRQWEMLADDGNGSFISPYVIFINKEASKPNPPGLNLGIWEVNTDLLTLEQAGGNLTTSNTLLTGNVQETALSVSKQALMNGLGIYPNPVSELLYIDTDLALDAIAIYDVRGYLVLGVDVVSSSIDVSTLSSGLYFLKINSESMAVTKKIVIN
ncbi:T9SS type A sorting domain-containing protein [Algibacter mikhailovii]|uniref:Secretion system C-terminal sorting domain-containing protein n=1 Tax=Algibacter mikhailovii TaxID=425498 RepID=A0A918QWP7_9FLAO|nr:T9SS type A sorting domain-containing protein [Algibacter mikhailovii]GGZ74281.1 hypothetical protein GCM10007028_09490 [Algibacter mikhailovii]